MGWFALTNTEKVGVHGKLVVTLEPVFEISLEMPFPTIIVDVRNILFG